MDYKFLNNRAKDAPIGQTKAELIKRQDKQLETLKSTVMGELEKIIAHLLDLNDRVEKLEKGF